MTTWPEAGDLCMVAPDFSGWSFKAGTDGAGFVDHRPGEIYIIIEKIPGRLGYRMLHGADVFETSGKRFTRKEFIRVDAQ